jgi:hypothetical protein
MSDSKIVLVHESPLYCLLVERKVVNGLVSVEVASLWPQTRQKINSIPHRQMQLNLPQVSVDRLAAALAPDLIQLLERAFYQAHPELAAQINAKLGGLKALT